MAESVRIDVPLEVSDDWPPVAVEALWATRELSGSFVIESIPVFALDLAVGDTVEARDAGSESVPVFERRIRTGGHATFRFIALAEAPIALGEAPIALGEPPIGLGDDPVAQVVHRLEQLGAVVVPSSFASLWALDVPPGVSAETIRAALHEAANREILEFEDPRTP